MELPGATEFPICEPQHALLYVVNRKDDPLRVALCQCRLRHQMHPDGGDMCEWADKLEMKRGCHNHRWSEYNEGHKVSLSYGPQLDTCCRKRGRNVLVIDPDVLCLLTNQCYPQGYDKLLCNGSEQVWCHQSKQIE